MQISKDSDPNSKPLNGSRDLVLDWLVVYNSIVRMINETKRKQSYSGDDRISIDSDANQSIMFYKYVRSVIHDFDSHIQSNLSTLAETLSSSWIEKFENHRNELLNICDTEINRTNRENQTSTKSDDSNKKYPVKAKITASTISDSILHDSNCKENANDNVESGKILGLLQKQKDISSQAIQEEHITQSMLTAELAESTAILKEATMKISQTVTEQNIQLEDTEKYAELNMKSLEEQRKMVSFNHEGDQLFI